MNIKPIRNKIAVIKIGRATITWIKYFIPSCDCWFSRLIPIAYCWHLHYIMRRREIGDPQFLFKSEGGKL